MVTPNDIVGRGEEIHLLVAADRVDQATKRVMDFVRDFSDDREDLIEVTVISNSYARLEKRERQGLLDYDEAERHRRKLLFQLLSLIDSIQESLSNQLAA